MSSWAVHVSGPYCKIRTAQGTLPIIDIEIDIDIKHAHSAKKDISRNFTNRQSNFPAVAIQRE